MHRSSGCCLVGMNMPNHAFQGNIQNSIPLEAQKKLVRAFNMLISVMILLEVLGSIPGQTLQLIPLFFGEQGNKEENIAGNKSNGIEQLHMIKPH